LPATRDILDEADAAVTADTDYFGPWAATAGLQQVALSSSNFNGQVAIQESRDASAVLQEWTMSGTLTGRILVPGAAYVRVRARFTGTGTWSYSLRGL